MSAMFHGCEKPGQQINAISESLPRDGYIVTRLFDVRSRTGVCVRGKKIVRFLENTAGVFDLQFVEPKHMSCRQSGNSAFDRVCDQQEASSFVRYGQHERYTSLGMRRDGRNLDRSSFYLLTVCRKTIFGGDK